LDLTPTTLESIALIIELGSSADKIIRSDNFKKKKVSDRDMLAIRTDAKSVLKAMCIRSYFRKCQSLIHLAGALSCLDLCSMAGSPEQCKTMMRLLLSACVEGGFVVERNVMRSCNSLMTSFTPVRRVNWKTFVLQMTALTHSFVAEWQLTVLRHGQFVS